MSWLIVQQFQIQKPDLTGFYIILSCAQFRSKNSSYFPHLLRTCQVYTPNLELLKKQSFCAQKRPCYTLLTVCPYVSSGEKPEGFYSLWSLSQSERVPALGRFCSFFWPGAAHHPKLRRAGQPHLRQRVCRPQFLCPKQRRLSGRLGRLS